MSSRSGKSKTKNGRLFPFLISTFSLLIPVMTTRIFVAGIIGGVVMFIWSFIGHDVLPLGQAGVSRLPNEQGLRDSLAADVKNRGLYMFPWPDYGPNASRQEKQEAFNRAIEREKTGPSGVLMYHPRRDLAFGRLLGIEFATELIEAWLLVWLLAQTRIDSFGGRVGFIFVAGILASLATNVPYWNWYGFPTVYTACYMLIQLIGFLLVGVVAALMLPRQGSQSGA